MKESDMEVVKADGATERMDLDFIKVVQERSGEEIQKCYQCQKCWVGCPIAAFMDIPPNKINRMIQYGLKDRIFGSSTIWLCSACETCATRCPNGIDIAKLMDVLKQLALEEGEESQERKITAFHSVFLSNIRKRGRLNEVSMLRSLKLRTGDLVKDLGLGIKLIKRGKLPIFSSKIEKMNEVKEIFEKVGGKS